MAHAFFVAGDSEGGIERAREFLLSRLSSDAPDITVLAYDAFPVEEARKLADKVYQTARNKDGKGIILSVKRIFHEAQNALLKMFEEPPEGTTLILVIPSAGLLLPTLRSRLVSLELEETSTSITPDVRAFIDASQKEREKIIEKLLTRVKAETASEKGSARADALALVEGLTVFGYRAYQKAPSASLGAFLEDLSRFTPILHERSAPLKLIFFHLLLTIPRGLGGLDKK